MAGWGAQFESGVSAVFESVLAPGAISDQPFFQIQGSKGEIVLDGFEGGGRVYTIDDGAAAEGDGGSGKSPMVCTDINEGFDGAVGCVNSLL